jgi:hypothetical protein
MIAAYVFAADDSLVEFFSNGSGHILHRTYNVAHRAQTDFTLAKQQQTFMFSSR